MHVDEDLLTLLALGETAGTSAERDHVASCTACAAELAELRRVVGLARSGETLEVPGPGVWAAVQEGLGKDPDAAGTERRHSERRHSELRAHVHLAAAQSRWSQASGEARLSTDEDGVRILRVVVHGDLPDEGLRQAWLVRRDDPARRQSLGVLDGAHGLWTVAHAIDLELYGLLEISQQDAESTEHSGETLLRGELVTAA